MTWSALKPREKALIRYLVLAVALGLLLLSVRSLGSPAQTARAQPAGAAAPRTAGAVQGEEAAMGTDLTHILSQVAGAGRVSVQVALRATEQQVYAVDHTTSATTQPGSPAQTQTQDRAQTVVVGNSALPVQVDGPQVASVLVVASGAADPAVAAALTEAAAAALGVPIYEVRVVEGS